MPSQPSTSSGTAYQNASTFLFVPGNWGQTATTADDTNLPGAYFRLGGSSDVENDISGDDLATFYPRQHIADAGSADAVDLAAGTGSSPRGIMLACNGRLLLRSAEKTYLHSTGAIHVDTESTLALNAGGAISMTSGKSISIRAGDGDEIVIAAGTTITTTAATSKRKINNNDYTEILEDTFTYYECDVYTYVLGGTVDVNMGGAFAFWMGSRLSINTSLDMSLSVASTFYFWICKFDMSVLTMDFCKNKMEFSEGKFKFSAWENGSYLAACKNAFSEIGSRAVSSAVEGIKSVTSSVESRMLALSAASGGPAMYNFGLVGFV